MTETQLKIQYVELSWDFKFPDSIDGALEDDYAQNPHLYDLDVLKHIQLALSAVEDLSPAFVLDLVRVTRSVIDASKSGGENRPPRDELSTFEFDAF